MSNHDDLPSVLHPSRFTPLQFSLDIAGMKAQFTINADGSLWMSDWEVFRRYYATIAFNDQNFGLLRLLFAARGHIREVDADARDAIAEEWAKQLPTPHFDVGMAFDPPHT